MLKRISLLLSLLPVLFLFNATPVSAQLNLYECRVQGSPCVEDPDDRSCDTANNYVPGDRCSTTPVNQCNSVSFGCVQDADNTGGFEQPCETGVTFPCNEGLVCNTSTNRCENCGDAGLKCCHGPTLFGCASGATCNQSTDTCSTTQGSSGNTTPASFTGGCVRQGVQGIDTAIGCIPYGTPEALATFFLRWGLGIGGGIALLFIIYASFIISTSSGDPRRMQGGKELLTSAIAGLMLLIFSVFILRILGVNILGIF